MTVGKLLTDFLLSLWSSGINTSKVQEEEKHTQIVNNADVHRKWGLAGSSYQPTADDHHPRRLLQSKLSGCWHRHLLLAQVLAA